MNPRDQVFTPFRAFLLALCLAPFAGCGGDTAEAAASTRDSAVQSQALWSRRPAPPSSVSAVAGDARVQLSWSFSRNASRYYVKRATSGSGPYARVASTTSRHYTDTSVTNGRRYYYVVSAANSSGEGANSAPVSATPTSSTQPPPAATPPAAPLNVAAKAGDARVDLSWSASSGATGYVVKRSTLNGGSYAQVATATSTSWVDTAVANGTTYYYVVAANNPAGQGPDSTQVSATPQAAVVNPPPASFGTWTNVTPSGVNLGSNLSCGNYGTETVQRDPAHPSHLYTHFHCQGLWRSTDYGATWTGPLNTGANGATVRDCAGGIAIAPNSTAAVPTIYQTCIRGAGTGFWRSTDGGVNWTRYFVAPSGSSRQDYYPPAIDPYDQNHLVMAGHEMNYLVESTDGGQTWRQVSTSGGMNQNGGTAAVAFIDTGNAATTRTTWLWLAQQSGGGIGTWRTTNGGASWTRVEKNEHPHGSSQIYQPDKGGVVYMAGAYSDKGWGVLRSADYGQTWTHVGLSGNETVVFGTSKNVYSMFGFPVGPGGSTDPSMQTAAQPGTGNWVRPGTPSGMTQGPAQVAVLDDGTHGILVGAMWNGGLWRYVEP